MVSYCVRYAQIVPLILSVYYMSRYQNFVLSQVVQVSWVIMKGKALESNYLLTIVINVDNSMKA